MSSARSARTRLDSPAQGAPRPAIFDAKCGGKGFVVTFVPATAQMLGDEVIAELQQGGAVFHHDGVLLAIKPASSEDRAAAKELLDAMVTSDDEMALIATMRSGFRRCYSDGLNGNPTMSGSLTVEASIGPSGEVVSATTKRVVGLSPSAASCTKAVVTSRQFAPPESGDKTVSISVVFAQQKSAACASQRGSAAWNACARGRRCAS